jgi:hypothetical protein
MKLTIATTFSIGLCRWVSLHNSNSFISSLRGRIIVLEHRRPGEGRHELKDPDAALCLNYCHEKGYEVSHRFSEAYSGLTLDRPKLRELQELIRAGYIDVIVIYCLDRISRGGEKRITISQSRGWLLDYRIDPQM